jgi:predicted dehydrogenase
MSAVSEKRLALVGVGRVSSAYLDVLAELPEVAVCAAVDPVPERTLDAMQRGARAFSSHDEMLGDGEFPDAALICTPPSERLAVVEPLLHAGVDCLIESPLAMLPSDARRIETAAERLGRTLVTVARFRASRALVEARRLIDAGRIGRLTYVETTLSGALDPKADWRGDPQVSGGGVWMDRGPQSIDVVETVAGPIERIRIVDQRREQGLEVEDEVAVETEHAGGILSRIQLSWNREIPAPIARCVGTEAELIVGARRTVLRNGAADEVVGWGFDPRDSLLALLDRFFARCAKGACDEDHGAQSVDWLYAGYASARSRRWELA